MSYQYPITTALQFLASFHHARVTGVGHVTNICWVEAFVDEDGTEEQHFLVLERSKQGEAAPQLKVFQNLSGVDLQQVITQPHVHWERGHTPVHGDDSRW